MIKNLIETYRWYLEVVVVSALVITAWAVGNTEGYKSGYDQGYSDNNRYWQALLVEEEFAEYHSKTGAWMLRTLDEVSLAGLIVGDKKKAKEFLRK